MFRGLLLLPRSVNVCRVLSLGKEGELEWFTGAVVAGFDQLHQDILPLHLLPLLLPVTGRLEGDGVLLVDVLSIEIAPTFPATDWVVESNLITTEVSMG